MSNITSRRSKLLTQTAVIAVILLGGGPIKAETELSADAAAAAADAPLEEVMVTAERRSERLHDAPMSVSVTDATRMEQLGITNTAELTELTPGLVMGMKGTFVQPSIRGISTPGTGPGIESNVPMYLDGVYMPSQASNIFDLSDISQVEVLKGPQGTLFGRNSTGGAIRIFTSDPQFTFGGDASASYGSYDDIRLAGRVTGPIVPNILAASLSVDYHTNDGYLKNEGGGPATSGTSNVAPLDARLVRAKLLFEPNDDLHVLLTAYAAHDSDPIGLALQPEGGNSSARVATPNTLIVTDPYGWAGTTLPRVVNDSAGGSLKADWALGIGSVTSTTGIQYSDLSGSFDGDMTPAFALLYAPSLPDISESEELLFTSNQYGMFSGLVGFFGYHDVGKYWPTQFSTPVSNTQIFSRVETTAAAGFADANIDVTDDLRLTAGGRYSVETRAFKAAINSHNLNDEGSTTWFAFTPRFLAKYKLSDEANVYASYNKGFTSGAYNPASTSNVPVSPEKIDAYETGVKFENNKFSLNAAAFYYNYENLQVTSISSVTNLSVLQNAAKAESYGLDLDGSWKVTKDFSVLGGLSPMHSTYTSFPSAAVNVPNPACKVIFPCGNVTVKENDTGNHLPKAPSLTSTLTLQYKFDLLQGQTTASTTWYHNSGFTWEAGNRVNDPAYSTLGFDVTWTAPKGGYHISVSGKNINGAKYQVSEFDTAGGDGVVYAAPAWYNVTIGVNF